LINIVNNDLKLFSTFVLIGIDTKNLTIEFLRFVEKFLTTGKSDSNHRPSIKSCLVRIPGTFNQKNGQQVKIIQKWDGKLPNIQ